MASWTLRLEFRKFAAAVRITGGMRSVIHSSLLVAHAGSSAEDMAAYLDGSIAPGDRARIEQHLADCAECRQEIAELRAMLSQAAPVSRRPQLPRRTIGLGLAAAAALIWIVAPRSAADRERVGAPQGADAALSIEVVHPRGDETVAGSFDLVWRAVAPDAAYRVTLSDSSGLTLWNSSTRDTTARPPRGILAAAGSRFFWSVDALLADGNTASSGSIDFTVRP